MVAPTSSGVDEAAGSTSAGPGRRKVAHRLVEALAAARRACRRNCARAFGQRRARRDAVHRDAGAGAGLREAAHDGQLRGLRHAVVQPSRPAGRIPTRWRRRSRGPSCAFMPGSSARARPHAAHHVDLEQALPFFVGGDLLEGLGLEDAEVVDEDVGLADGAGQRWCSRRIRTGRQRRRRRRSRDRCAQPGEPASTDACVRPLIVTIASRPPRRRAIAKPIPAVDPVTTARLPRSCRSIGGAFRG